MSILSVVPHISDQQFSQAVEDLKKFVEIPSVSNPNNPDYSIENLRKAAAFASTKLTELNFKVSTLCIGESAPFIIAERISNKNKPTILLYAHYDVQPVDRKEWKSNPFIVDERDERLYGRGASDDKAGIIAIITALGACLKANIELPNVKILLEGEEEYGSSHMSTLLKQETERVDAHALVVLDGMNRDVQTGTLASSTRGLVNIKLQVNALDKPVHSGIGCLVPDPAQTLISLTHSLKDPKAIPGFMDDCTPLSEREVKLLRENSISAEVYAKDTNVKPNVLLRGDPNKSIYERLMNEPSISIVNMHCGQPNGGNSIQDSASCTIGIRVLPGQDPDKVGKAVIEHLKKQPTLYKEHIQIDQIEKGSYAWKANLAGPFSNKYLEALQENFPQACFMPMGGALPLLREFELIFPNMEMIVPAVEDSKSDAHSHNESQHIGVFRKAIDSLIAFLDKSARVEIMRDNNN